MQNREKIKRSRDDRMIAGVAGGLGKYFDTDPTFIRLLFVITTFITEGLMIWVYILMAIIVPEEEKSGKKLPAGTQENEPAKESVPEEEDDPIRTGELPANLENKKEESKSGVWLGIGLVVLGLLLLIDRLDLFWWLSWRIMWPLLLVLLGIWIILRRGR
ncbi:PspC domain-containing protein [Methanolobus sp. WCC5]|uniref:PspC domain-containing protein n=1 Tax=Methanolobus sp. WCC5 TaxID=3125785 RepID=UPI00324CF82B